MSARWFVQGVRALALCWGLSVGFALNAADVAVPVDQGWSASQKTTWYTLSQGSRLIPLGWLQALEQPGTSALFLDRAHMEQFRYLPNASSAPGQLPVGFAIDTQNDKKFSEITRLRWKKPQSANESWVGMNCAACHTAEITFQGKRLRIEGGPTLADFQGFMRTLNRALTETRDNPEKWNRFAKGVLGNANTTANRDMLKGALAQLVQWQLKVENANETPLEYGFARLDAFGHIFNKVLLRVEATGQPRNPADAPVSYPFLWNIHQHDKVQWNGIASNAPLSPTLDVGALARNVGEVTGVFADLTLKPIGPAVGGYTTSANVKNLLRLEQQLTSLKPPVWPEVFPLIDAAKWEAGKEIFNRKEIFKGIPGCVTCHEILPRDDLKTKFKVEMTRLIGPKAIGTDPWMACNAYTYQGRSGVLQHTPRKFFVFSGPPLGETAAVGDLLGATVAGSIWFKRHDLAAGVKQALATIDSFDPKVGPAIIDPAALAMELTQDLDADKEARRERCMSEASPVLAYKGRPLTGIWATPPYLHNGSVPTLYDLLLPPAKRPTSFAVGTREFDPERVGYVTDGASAQYLTERSKLENTFVFRTHDAGGRAIAGNSNAGHDYGNASLTKDDRLALVEYMKAAGATRKGDTVVP